MKHDWVYVIFESYTCSKCYKSVITTGMSEDEIEKFADEECSGVFDEYRTAKDTLNEENQQQKHQNGDQ